MVTVYGASWCGDCHASRQVLDSLGIVYSYKDIDSDDAL
ncbi:glutaredoxin family protein [Candidatus Saccharibacteria bacterium]|nr:glutaredoxin family protein [Candidatus Saccharibacteria bacterium]